MPSLIYYRLLPLPFVFPGVPVFATSFSLGSSEPAMSAENLEDVVNFQAKEYKNTFTQI